MLIRRPTLDAIAAGEVTLAFRRWERPRVRPGTRLRTAVGVVEVVDVTAVDVERLTEDDATAAGYADVAALRTELDRRPGTAFRVALRPAGPDPRVALRERSELPDAERAALRARLERLDRASPRGPWTAAVLDLVEAKPGVRAPDLAALLGRDTVTFKRDVRKLKELGLTESLPVGYRLSPRGRAYRAGGPDDQGGRNELSTVGAVAMLQFDEEGARRIDRTYATSDVVAQRAAVLALLDLQPGERVVDVGSGPGYLLASMADAVGPGGAVHGVDPSPPMNALARARAGDRDWVQVTEGDALALPLPDRTVDVAVSTQVLEYVTDVPAALAELRRVLRPRGRVLLLDTDWDSVVWHVADRVRHARVMAAWDEHLVHPRLPRTLAALVRRAGFTVTGQHVIPLFNGELREESYSANTMDLIAAFVPGRQGLTADDARGWLADLRARAAEGEYFFNMNRYCVLAAAP